MSGLLQHLGYAARLLRKNRGITAVALTVASGLAFGLAPAVSAIRKMRRGSIGPIG
jgi:hypothetical protein